MGHMGAILGARSRRLAIGAATLVAAVTVAVGPGPATTVAALDADPREAIAAGNNHQCAILADQTVRCWGANDLGQLGDGSTDDSLAPVAVQGLSGVVAIDAGADFTCALVEDGTVGCWGRNTSGSLGEPAAVSFATTPTFANGLVDVVEITVGETHTCARVAAGDVFCWGDNDDEQLGDGTSTDTHVPVAASGLTDAVQISAGFATTCAVRAGGTLACWGANVNGAYGNGATASSATPLDIPEAGAVEKVDVGFLTNCILAEGGRARCAGAAPLGDGSNDASADFVDVDLPPVLDISVGGETCAIAPNATVWCWGGDFRLVDGSFDGVVAFFPGSGRPEQVAALDDVTALDAGRTHTCAGSIDGTLSCWGVNVGGELQTEGTIVAEPGTVVPGVTATELAMGFTNCAVTTAAGVACWGVDLLESVAFSSQSFDQLTAPKQVAGVDAAVDVDTAFLHACAALSDGSVSCWGYNLAGELGSPGTSSFDELADPDPPSTVTGVTGATDVAAGYHLSCANGAEKLQCWGLDESGQLGNGLPEEDSPTPTPVVVPAGTIGSVLLDAGGNHACGRVVGFIGSVLLCWGGNSSGQLGNGTIDASPEPVSTGIIAPKSVATGLAHTCAIDGNDDLYCWGRNDDGQIGNALPGTDVLTPHLVAGLPATPTRVTAAGGHTCAVLVDGTVACWGTNDSGETGQPGSGLTLAPSLVPGITGAVDIASSSLFGGGAGATCVILNDGSVSCWGSNIIGMTGRSPYVFEPADMGLTSLLAPSTLRTEPIFRPVTPARLLETRDGLATVDGISQGGGAVRGGTQLEVPVAGRAGVPDDAKFVVVNVTAVNPQLSGFLTVHGCLSPRPNVASLNYTNQGGDGPVNLGNETIVELSANGAVCVFTSSSTELTIDVTAYGIEAGGYAPTIPERLLETRPGKSTGDGEFELGAPIEGGSEVELDVRGRAGIGDDAQAAVLYIAAVNPTGVGFVTAHPCLDDLPTASSLNYSVVPGAGGINRGNEVLAPLSADGTVCLYAATTTHLTVDVMGSTSAATTYEPVAPARLLETRPGQPTVDDDGVLGAPIAGGAEVELQVTGRAGIDPEASMAALNITAVRPTGSGFVTAHPCEPSLPLASSLNFAAPPVSGPINGGNEVLAPLSSTGTVCLFVSDTTHLTVDVVGSS